MTRQGSGDRQDAACGNDAPLVTPLLSPADSGRINRARVLRLLSAHGPLSRTELARCSGSQRSVIGPVVQPLLDDGLLIEQPPRPSGPSGGKPSRPLWFADHSAPIGAIHLMPHLVQGAVVGVDGHVRATRELAIAPGESQAVMLEAVLQAAAWAMETSDGQLRGIGIAVGGMVNTQTGEIIQMDLAPRMNGMALVPALRARFDVPVVLDLHPRAQALGDLWFGTGKHAGSFASVYCRDAIGAAFVFDGTVQRGPGGAGGELGHLPIVASGGDAPRRWNSLATVGWLRQRAAELDMPNADRLTGLQLSRLVCAGDGAAQQLHREYARNLALGLAAIYQLLAPELMILHGDPAEAGSPLRDAIETDVTALVSVHPAVAPRVVMAPLDDLATLRGGACLILAEMFRFSL